MIAAVQHNKTGETGENGGNTRFSLLDKTGEMGEKPIRLSPAVVSSPVAYCASAKGKVRDMMTTEQADRVDAKLMKGRCQTCQWFRATKDGGVVGVCMAHPPVWNGRGLFGWNRPPVDAVDYCSEHATVTP